MTHEPLPQLCDVRGDRCCGTPACLNAGKWSTSTREPSHDMWDAALHAALTHSHARDGHPNPAVAADRTIATAPRLDHDGDDAAEVIAEDRAVERGERLRRYNERKQP